MCEHSIIWHLTCLVVLQPPAHVPVPPESAVAVKVTPPTARYEDANESLSEGTHVTGEINLD